jgi:hypothetical protein
MNLRAARNLLRHPLCLPVNFGLPLLRIFIAIADNGV